MEQHVEMSESLRMVPREATSYSTDSKTAAKERGLESRGVSASTKLPQLWDGPAFNHSEAQGEYPRYTGESVPFYYRHSLKIK